MLKPLSFNDWLEAYLDEIPEEEDLHQLYDNYVEEVEEINLDAQLNNLNL